MSGLKGDVASVRCVGSENCAGAPFLLVETGLLSSVRNSSHASSGLRPCVVTLLANLFLGLALFACLSPIVSLPGRGHAYVVSIPAHVMVPVFDVRVA